MTLEELHGVLELASNRRLSSTYPLYELRRSPRSLLGIVAPLQRRQLMVLDAVRTLPWSPYLHYPNRRAALRGFQHAAELTWSVPAPLPSQSFLDAPLSSGSWQLYLGAAPVVPTRIPSLFTDRLPDIFSGIESNAIPVLVQAAPGNHEWRVVVQPSAVPAAIAA